MSCKKQTKPIEIQIADPGSSSNRYAVSIDYDLNDSGVIEIYVKKDHLTQGRMKIEAINGELRFSFESESNPNDFCSVIIDEATEDGRLRYEDDLEASDV